MHDCNLDINQIINKYMEFGWDKLTTIFINKRFAKEKLLNDNVDSYILELLGSIRKYTVNNYFLCVNKNRSANIYLPVGSTNITSDYDVEVIGRDAPEIVWKMFNKFLDKYDKLLPLVFDTNLYSVGLYSKLNIINTMEVVQIPKSNIVSLSPKQPNDIKISLYMAMIKLLNLQINPTYKYIANNLKSSQIYKEELEYLFDKEFKKFKKKYKNKYNNTALNLITMYKLNYIYAKKVYSILYGNKLSTDLLIKYVCFAQYYSIESYFTPCTINVVVFKLQQKQNLKLTQIDYICSVIENLGDLNEHLLNELKHSNNKQELLLKYSKYIYRLYYSIGKANNDTIFLDKATAINKNIIPHRGTLNENIKLDFKLMDYNEKSIEKYLSKINNNTFKIIDKLLEKY